MPTYQGSQRISSVGVTDDTITGRAGVSLFVRYLSRVGIYPILEGHFGHLRKSKKGGVIWHLFMQVFCFLFDGTSRHVSYFDDLKKDEGYAANLEGKAKDMASSHAMKRFFKLFGFVCGSGFRHILNQLFVWRLKITRPEEVLLTIDTMVMDNDEAPKRHGVQPTYKKKKGFQPLQMIWAGKIVDAVFRGGKKHSNYGNTAINMIKRMVPVVRQACGDTVRIVIRLDAGFFDEKIIKACSELQVGWILSGKIVESVKRKVKYARKSRWQQFKKGDQIWDYLEFTWGCDSWEQEYRAFYTRPRCDDTGQLLLDFARPENVILTNLGIDDEVIKDWPAEQQEHWTKSETIIAGHHGRGADELPHRGLKDFGFEALPFKRFGPNMAFYYCMLIAFFLHEAFKEDVLSDVLPISSYATTVRRKVVDVAAKFIKSGGSIVLKVVRAARDRLQFDELWSRCQSPIPIASE